MNDKSVYNGVRVYSRGMTCGERFSNVAGGYSQGKMHPLVSFVLLAFSSCLIKEKARSNLPTSIADLSE